MGALKTILNILYEAVVTIIVKYHIVAIPLYYFDFILRIIEIK